MSAKAGSATNITYQEYFLLLGLSQRDFLTLVLRSDKTFCLRALISANRDYMVVRTRIGTMCVPWLSSTAVRCFLRTLGLVMRFLLFSLDFSIKAKNFDLSSKRACHPALTGARLRTGAPGFGTPRFSIASGLEGTVIERSMSF